MIEISLIVDKIHYQKKHIDEMEKLFKKNFITHEDQDLEKKFRSDHPEIRIYLRLTQGVLPVEIFRAVDKDFFKTVTNEAFLKAFLNNSSNETPTLIFHFVGKLRSFEFRIRTKDEENIKEGSETVFDKLFRILKSEELPPITQDAQSFEFEGGEWKKLHTKT